ncbi:MAG: helix-turn-helix domain-containing protein [Tsuneonella suprasediminis]
MAHGGLSDSAGAFTGDEHGGHEQPPPQPERRRTYKGGARLAPAQLRKAQELMFEQLTGTLQLVEIAAELGMSTVHFKRAFKNTVGIPPYGWHLRQRIARSASLLHDETLTLAEIAATCGFSDQSHYTKAFRRLLGITPGKWRRKLRAGVARNDDLIKLN